MIEIKQLTKSFEGQVILKEATANCLSGKITCIVGANGVGKTTLLAMLAGLLESDRGEIVINRELAQVPYSKSLREQIFYLSTDKLLFDYLDAREHLQYFARLKGDQVSDQLIEQIVADFQLASLAGKLIKDYSFGMKQRLQFAIIELLDRPYLLLDEPTIGLDIEQQNRLAKRLLNYKAAGKTVIITSHDFHLVTALSDVCYRLGEGQIKKIDRLPQFDSDN